MECPRKRRLYHTAPYIVFKESGGRADHRRFRKFINNAFEADHGKSLRGAFGEFHSGCSSERQPDTPSERSFKIQHIERQHVKAVFVLCGTHSRCDEVLLTVKIDSGSYISVFSGGETVGFVGFDDSDDEFVVFFCARFFDCKRYKSFGIIIFECLKHFRHESGGRRHFIVGGEGYAEEAVKRSRLSACEKAGKQTLFSGCGREVRIFYVAYYGFES